MAGINNQILGELDLKRRAGLEIIASVQGAGTPDGGASCRTAERTCV